MNPTKAKAGSDQINGSKPATKASAPEMRRPPAYQTYASDDLASEAYYGLSLASRGLFDAMLRVIWVNGYVPKEAQLLAKAVRADLDDVTTALTPALVDQFVTLDSDRNRLTHPELERQRTQLEHRREKQRNGGREGARRRYSSSPPKPAKAIGQPIGSEMKCNDMNRAEEKRTRCPKDESFSDTEDATEACAEGYADEERRCME